MREIYHLAAKLFRGNTLVVLAFGFFIVFLSLPSWLPVFEGGHSREVSFFSLSPRGPSGGAIIPASCESGYEHFAGECGGSSTSSSSTSSTSSTSSSSSSSSTGGPTICHQVTQCSLSTNSSTCVVGSSGDFTSGLVAWWKMDETSGTSATDSSGNSHTGTLNNFANPPTTTSTPISGWMTVSKAAGISSLAFDGSDDYVSTGSQTLKTLNNFSISVWFKADSTTATKHILWEGQSTGNGWGGDQEMHITLGDSVSGTASNNKLSFFFGSSDSSSSAIHISTAFTDTTSWHNVVVSVANLSTSPSATMYLDGVSVGSDTGTTVGVSRSNWNNNLRFGRPGTSERYFDGLLDEIRIYNTTLSSTDASNIYAGSPTSSGLIDYWSFNENTGTSAADTGGGSNTGTLNNFASPPNVLGPSGWSTSGKLNGALSFDGSNDYVDAGTSGLGFTTGNFSIAAWTYVNSTSSAMFAYHGLGCSSWASYFLSIGGTENAEVPGYYAFGFGTSNAAANHIVYSPLTATTSRWVHLTGVYDGNYLFIYLDGLLAYSTPATGHPWSSAEHLYFGADPGCGVRSQVNGKIDDVRVYNRALSPGDVGALWAGTAPACTSGNTCSQSNSACLVKSCIVGAVCAKSTQNACAMETDYYWNSTCQCLGPGGSTAAPTPPDSSTCPQPNISAVANPTLLNKGGQCTVTWSASNATSCTLSGTGMTGSTTCNSLDSCSRSNAALSPTLQTSSTYTLSCNYNGAMLQTKTVRCVVNPVFVPF